MAPVEVAVGVVVRPDGRVLLGQRVAGKPYAGWWEFPGGKLERGESVGDALARELHEELGLERVRSTPWVVRTFTYPHATVRLHFRRVEHWRGDPVSREGQAFAWFDPVRVDCAPLLPATVPVIAWLRWPAVVTVGAEVPDGSALHVLELSDDDEGALDAAFRRARAAARANGGHLLVSSRHPASYAAAADGLLVRAADVERWSVRPAFARVLCETPARASVTGDPPAPAWVPDAWVRPTRSPPEPAPDPAPPPEQAGDAHRWPDPGQATVPVLARPSAVPGGAADLAAWRRAGYHGVMIPGTRAGPDA